MNEYFWFNCRNCRIAVARVKGGENALIRFAEFSLRSFEVIALSEKPHSGRIVAAERNIKKV